MEKTYYCNQCIDFRSSEQVYYKDSWHKFCCAICHGNKLDKISFAPINKKVNRLIKQCTKATGKNSIDVLREALTMYIAIRGYDD